MAKSKKKKNDENVVSKNEMTKEEMYNRRVDVPDEEIEEIVEDIYEQDDGSTVDPAYFEKPHASTLYTLKYTFLAALVGLLAGVTGVLWVVSGGWPFESDVSSLFGERQLRGDSGRTGGTTQVTVSLDERVATVVDRVSTSVVTFVALGGSEDDTDTLTEPSWPYVSLGLGSVITNDGWIVTSPGVIGDRSIADVRVLTLDGELYEIVDSYEDFLEPLYYVRVAAVDLLPVNFAMSADVRPGHMLLSLDPGPSRSFSRLHTGYVSQVKWLEDSTLSDLVVSSEVYSTRLLVDFGAHDLAQGTPLFDLAGTIVGMVVLEDSNVRVLPVDAITHANASFFEDKEVVRTWLGVRYIDLSFAPGLDESLSYGYSKGALIYSAGTEAIEEGSPAQKAELQSGDIVLEVEKEEVNGRYNLTELIQSYPPGEEVSLLVYRDGEEVKISVILGELK